MNFLIVFFAKTNPLGLLTCSAGAWVNDEGDVTHRCYETVLSNRELASRLKCQKNVSEDHGAWIRSEPSFPLRGVRNSLPSATLFMKTEKTILRVWSGLQDVCAIL